MGMNNTLTHTSNTMQRTAHTQNTHVFIFRNVATAVSERATAKPCIILVTKRNWDLQTDINETTQFRNNGLGVRKFQTAPG
jgi:hypothetical protein